jgi:hypothetical protein
MNVANPGTYDADDDGTHAPNWDITNGWKGNGSSMYLNTGIQLSAIGSAIIKFTNETTSNSTLFGALYTTESIAIQGNYSGNLFYYNGNSGVNYAHVGGGLTSGVLAVTDKPYKDGSEDTTASGSFGTWSGTSGEIYILALNYQQGTPIQYSPGYVQAFAVYNTVLTAAQISALTTAMNAL